MSRGYIPGDQDPGDYMDTTTVLSRSIRAQITAVDNKNGFVTFTYDGLPSGGRVATVEPLWMSFPTDGKSAWGRYMPQESDIIKIEFAPDDTPKMAGYDTDAPMPGVGNGDVGWPAINEQYKKCAAGENDDRPQFANFRPLEPGEFDFMSSGGGYIHASDKGRLYMAGGPVTLTLTKNELKLHASAQAHHHVSENSEIRFGQVRRKINHIDQKIPTDTSGALREFNVSVSNTLPLASFKMGDVADSAAVQNSDKGQPMRALLEAYGEASQKSFELQIDKLGNTILNATTAEFVSTYASYVMKASSTYTVNASSAYTVSSPVIKLGGDDSAHPLFLTNVYSAAEKQVIGQLAAQVNALSIATFQAITAIAGWAAPLAPLPVVPGSAIAALSATLALLIPPIATPGPAATTAATTFTSAYDTYLSKISKTS